MNAHRNTLHLATILLALAPALFAQGPHKAPKQEGTVKPAVGVPSDLFERQMALIGPRKAGWLGKAAQATPGAAPRRIFSARNECYGLIENAGFAIITLCWNCDSDQVSRISG